MSEEAMKVWLEAQSAWDVMPTAREGHQAAAAVIAAAMEADKAEIARVRARLEDALLFVPDDYQFGPRQAIGDTPC